MSSIIARPWLMLGVLFLARTCAGYAFQSVGSTGPAIAASLAIDFVLIGTLIGLFNLPGIPLSIPSGTLAGYAGERVLITCGLALIAVGTAITACSSTFTTAAFGRLIAGIGFVIANLYFAKATLDWFSGTRHLPLAMGILVSSWPFGITLGLMTQSAMAVSSGWKSAMMACAFLAAASTVLMVLLYREAPNRTVPLATGLAALRAMTVAEWRDVMLIGAVWSLLNVGLVIAAGFAPALLTAMGYELSYAGRLVSIALWVSLISIPIGGIAAGLFGARSVIIFCTLITAPVYFAIAHWPDALWVYVAFGIFGAAAAGPIMAQPPTLLQPQNRAAGMGVFYTVYYVFMTTLPPLAGWLRDVSGPRAPFYFAIAVNAASLACCAALWLRGPDQRPS